MAVIVYPQRIKNHKNKHNTGIATQFYGIAKEYQKGSQGRKVPSYGEKGGDKYVKKAQAIHPQKTFIFIESRVPAANPNNEGNDSRPSGTASDK